ncbi:MAG: SDR family oxidoreductase [Pirellulales bacterium]|nr:SDR family oxidoreductase [Pirellulales bacterium]
MSGGFAKTTAVVTGASSGIGRATAIALARAGAAKLVIHYRENQRGARQTLQEIEKQGCRGWLIQADLTSPEDVKRLIESAFETLGTVHAWVNNAGADVLTGDAGQWTFEKKMRHLFEVDVLATVDLSRRVAERMMGQPNLFPPSLVFIGWDQAPHGMEGDAGQMFGPVKAAVMAYAASLAQSVAPHVRVNTVAPGWIQTAWGTSASEYWDRRAKDQSLMTRWGTAEDVARAIVYAADPENTFLNGQTIQINGGWNRRYRD